MTNILGRLKRRVSNAGETMSVNSIKEKEEVGSIPEPEEIYNWKLYVVALTASAAAIIIGYDAGFIGGTVALTSFKEEFGLDKMSESEVTTVNSNVVSVFQAGAFWGALLFYPLVEVWGRKIGLILSGFLLTFGAAISLAAKSSEGLWPIYTGRVLTGVGIGGCSGISPIFVSEISPASVRGKLAGTWEVSWQIGGIVGYWINYGVLQNLPDSRKQWMIPFAIQLVPSGIFWIGTFLIPESPRFYVNKGKISKARRNLAYLRNLPEDHPYSIHEMNNIIKNIEEKKASLGRGGFMAPVIKIFTTKKLIYRLFLSTSLFVMQNGFGINAITYYSPTIFKSLGVNGTNAGLQSTGIFGLLKGFASVVWIFFLVDTLGRRFLFIACGLPCSLCMWYIGSYIKIANPSARLASGNTKVDAGGKTAQALLYIWTIFYGISWNGAPWVFNSEIFSQDVRTATQSINAAANWFWAFVLGRWTGEALNAIGYKLYFIFAACMIVFPIIVYFLYPEPKGVPLEAIDYLFEVPAWRARDHALKKFQIEFENVDVSTQENADVSGQDIESLDSYRKPSL